MDGRSSLQPTTGGLPFAPALPRTGDLTTAAENLYAGAGLPRPLVVIAAVPEDLLLTACPLEQSRSSRWIMPATAMLTAGFGLLALMRATGIDSQLRAPFPPCWRR